MEDKGISTSRRSSIGKTGCQILVSSFLAANVECQYFGTFRVPKEFHTTVGVKLPKSLRFKCKSFIWRGKYDAELTKICGLRRFMKYYGIKLFNLVQFDYYGEGVFIVKIFKETAIECNYPSIHPEEFINSKAGKIWREDQFMMDWQSLEYQKMIALLTFNGFRNHPDYVHIDIISFDIDPRVLNLRLKPSLESFFKHWKHGSSVFLRFVKRTWEIEVEWMGGSCMFGKGWYDFVRETEIDVGDAVVMYKISNAENILNVCIFKVEDYINDAGEGSLICDRSFFKVVSGVSLRLGGFIVPKLVKEKYHQKLNRMNELKVAGQRWFIFYNANNGYLHNLDKMMERFSLREREMVLFSMDDSNVMSARVYQEDGMEINYESRCQSNTDCLCGDWIWKVDWPTDSESEDEGEVEVDGIGEGLVNNIPMDAAAMNNGVIQFSVSLSDCHVNNKSHGVYIPKNINPANRQWTSEDEITFRTNIGSWKIRLAFSHGRARFSAGWNEFKRANGLKKKDTLDFNMVEEEGLIVFDITKHRT